MPQRRERPLNPRELTIEGLTPNEIVTLWTVSSEELKGKLAVTKQGGLWPIILSELSLKYEFSDEEVLRAAASMASAIRNYPLDQKSDPDLFARAEIKLIDIFLHDLLGDYYEVEVRDVHEFLFENFRKYSETLGRLIDDGFIEDPLSYLGLVVLGFIPYTFNSATREGGIKTRKIEAAFWSINHERGPHGSSFDFNFKLIKKLRKMIEVVVTTR